MKKVISIIVLIFCCLNTFAQENVYSDNIVIIFDDSGSMEEKLTGFRENKMHFAKNAIKSVVNNVSSKTNIGIVTFNSSILYDLSQVNVQEINLLIDSIRPGGGTPLGRHLKIGADILLRQREKQFGYGSYRLLVITDGLASDQAYVDKYGPEIISRGITLDIIGVDMETDIMLAQIASSYKSVNDPNALNKAVTEIFAEIGGAGNDSVSQEEAFKEIAGIPDEVALGIVQSYRIMQNHPIGEKPQIINNQTINKTTLKNTTTQSPCAFIGFFLISCFCILIFSFN